jgi:hypothetical protein
VRSRTLLAGPVLVRSHPHVRDVPGLVLGARVGSFLAARRPEALRLPPVLTTARSTAEFGSVVGAGIGATASIGVRLVAGADMGPAASTSPCRGLSFGSALRTVVGVAVLAGVRLAAGTGIGVAVGSSTRRGSSSGSAVRAVVAVAVVAGVRLLAGAHIGAAASASTR